MELLLKVSEVANILRLDPQTIYRWIKTGKLQTSRIGKRGLRIPKDEIYRLLETTPSFRDQAASEARDFMAAHPDYLPSVGNEKAILDFIDRNNLPVTSESITTAFEILTGLGTLEPRPIPTPTQEEVNA
jgi:excisionase family DNA binding protein